MIKKNYDQDVVDDFGDEWEIYNHSSCNVKELQELFSKYFCIFPWNKVVNGVGADLGCGTGRWASFVSEKVKLLICIDASNKAARVAKKNISDNKKCHIIQGRIDCLPLEDNSLDFAYSLGVLHHLPDTADALKKGVRKLKKGAPFLLYLYYAVDNRPIWYYFIWKLSDFFRKIISKAPFYIKYPLSIIIALAVYFPLSRMSLLLEMLNFNVRNIPLSHYRSKSFYILRTDALDRFGTKLERRFTKKQIRTMMEDAGLANVEFSNNEPFWCAVGIKST